MLAFDLRYDNDTDNVQDDDAPRRTQNRQDDRQNLLARNRSHWGFLQLVSDLRQHYISLPGCGIYTNAQGHTLSAKKTEIHLLTEIQATTPVAVLLASWALGTEKANMTTLFKVSFIVIGVVIASFGEIEFVLIGFMFQLGGIVFEAIRLVLVQKLLSSAEYKMDPLVSLYYFAPVCAIMNFCVAAVLEIPRIKMAEVYHVGLPLFFVNACIAFALNVSVVFLIGRTSSLVLTLCGVLKDILLVVISVTFRSEPVTALQVFGYGIALAGLVYYKLGADMLKAKVSDAGRAWADYGVRHPALRKVIVFAGMLLLVLIALIGLAPQVGYDSNYLSSVVGQSDKAV
ncbi:MAG: hypothetical protein Q9216_002257 [Gyalolechia sp. 2 TL-2023]